MTFGKAPHENLQSFACAGVAKQGFVLGVPVSDEGQLCLELSRVSINLILTLEVKFLPCFEEGYRP